MNCYSIDSMYFHKKLGNLFYYTRSLLLQIISSLKKGWFKQWLEKEEHAMRMCFRKGFMDS